MMYRYPHTILVVDDEPEVADGIVEMLECLQDNTCHAVYSAAQAIDALQKNEYDLVITDIKMPEMTGLELYDVIKQHWPECSVIFLSGIRSFDYVYRSVQNRDVRYITKMEPEEKIVAIVCEMLEQQEEQYRIRDLIEKTETQLAQALPLLQNEYFEKLLYGALENQEKTQKQLVDLRFPFELVKPVFTFIATFDCKILYDSVNFQDYFYKLKTLIDECSQSSLHLYSYIYMQDFLFVAMQQKNEIRTDTSAFFRAVLARISNTAAESLGLTVSILYNEKLHSFWKSASSFAKLKHSYSLLSPDATQVIRKSEIQLPKNLDKSVSNVFPNQKIAQMETCLELGQYSQFQNIFLKAVAPLQKISNKYDLRVWAVYYQISAIYMKFIGLWELSQPLSALEDLSKLGNIGNFSTVIEAITFLQHIGSLIFQLKFQCGKDGDNDTIRRICKHIQKHLSDDLSLNALGDYVGLNTSYLSRLFKDEKGICLSEYVSKKRMELAQQLLQFSSKRIHEIGQAIGYHDSQTFIRAFRKYCGITPLEYRKQLGFRKQSESRGLE